MKRQNQLVVMKRKIKSVVKETEIHRITGRQPTNVIIEEEEIAPLCK